MGKDNDTPSGPNWSKLLKKVKGFVKENQELFGDAMKFGKEQFTGGEAFVKQIQDFGMDAMGKLGTEAANFKADVDKRISGLDTLGAKFGTAVDTNYADSKATAEKITGELMPGFESSAKTGDTLIDRYSEQGIPFQDEYIKKLGGWDSTERREGRAAEAISDINASTEAARESELRRLESYGIDPSQTRSAALDSRIQAQNAVTKAQAANTGRRSVETEGIQLGKVASDMYNESLTAGRGLVESASNQGKNIAAIERQPGQDYASGLEALGAYGRGVGELEQAGGRAGYEMSSDAAKFGERGVANAAAYYDTNRKYGSGVYDQGSKILGNSASMLTGGWDAANASQANDLAAAQQAAENSPMGALGKLAGIAIPAALGSPWLGTAMGVASGAAALSKGGPISRDLSPSRGAIPDDIPAFLDADEYVLDRNTVRWHGVKNLSKLQKEAREGMAIPEGGR